MEEPSKAASDAEAIFTKILQSQWPWDYKGATLSKRYEEAASADASSTARLFYETDFRAWLAYHYWKHRVSTQYTFEKKAEVTAIIHSFDASSVRERKQTAERLKTAMQNGSLQCHTTVPTEVEGLRTKRSAKRRRVDNEQSSAHSVTAEIMPASESDGETSFQHNDHDHAFDVPNEILAIPATDERQTLSSPSFKRLAHIFPPYLCKRIRQSGLNASVEMIYRFWGLNCTLELHVLPKAIQHLAMDLYGTNLEPNEGAWNILQSNGGNHCFERMIFRGAGCEAINRVFGVHVARAIEQSHTRQQEATLETECVKFQITGNTADDGKFTLDLEWEASFVIKSILFPGI
ncbi:hypothetical protein PSPO01_16669 [Paraphaeosphaeria sporulosa]